MISFPACNLLLLYLSDEKIIFSINQKIFCVKWKHGLNEFISLGGQFIIIALAKKDARKMVTNFVLYRIVQENVASIVASKNAVYWHAWRIYVF